MELVGEAGGVRVYDDFAHHPTAITTTIDGLRRRTGAARLVAVLEPRSNTMRLGVHRESLAPSLAGADAVWLYSPADLGWDIGEVTRPLGAKARSAPSIEALLDDLDAHLREGDQVLVMSNGGFGGLHRKLLERLRARL
jgi:UDP-N-acetylmuramate: L-alanyl-gamma-D-glutamyl-meso-diaminopimelate ligase